MKVDLTYTVPVIVTVENTKGGGRVERVFLDRERIALTPSPAYESGTSNRVSATTRTRAVKTAENNEWPAWDS